jgi:N-acetylhexosamine 1-kinase
MRKVTRILSTPDEYPLAQANRLISRFDLPRPVETHDFPDKGNINQYTFLIRAPSGQEYLLQRINEQVFTRPRCVMRAMIASIEAQKSSLARGGLPEGEEWEAITLIPTREGSPYLEAENRRGSGVWRLMVKIRDARTFKSLSEIAEAGERSRVAREAGRGLALYGDFTSEMDTSVLENPLPGYRDTRLYYGQLRSVLEGNRTLEEAAPFLPADPIVRGSTAQHFLVHLPEEEYQRRMKDPDLRDFISLARDEEEFGTTLLRGVERGEIRTVAIHGDTKLDNFLFSTRTGRAKALIDLDTIMPHTWLTDWGDMVRSLVNVAGEKERDLGKVQVDMAIFRAVAEGFLGSARKVTPEEVRRMVDAVQIIALELGIRFLSDYLRGDSYFKLGPADPPDLNKVRAMVQLTLFLRLREKAAAARSLIDASREKRSHGTKPGAAR